MSHATPRAGSGDDSHRHVAELCRSKRTRSGMLNEKPRGQRETRTSEKNAQRVQKSQKLGAPNLRRSLRISPSASAAGTNIGPGVSSEVKDKGSIRPSDSANEGLVGRRPLPGNRLGHTGSPRGRRTRASDSSPESTSGEANGSRQVLWTVGSKDENPASVAQSSGMQANTRCPRRLEGKGGGSPDVRHHERDGMAREAGNDCERSLATSSAGANATPANPRGSFTRETPADKQNTAAHDSDDGHLNRSHTDPRSEPGASEGGVLQGDALRQGACGNERWAVAVEDRMTLSSGSVITTDTLSTELDVRGLACTDDRRAIMTPPSSITPSATGQAGQVKEAHDSSRIATQCLVPAANDDIPHQKRKIRFSFSEKFNAEYIDQYGQHVLQMVKNTEFLVTRNKQTIKMRYSHDKCVKYVEYFLHDCIGGAAECIGLILKEMDTREEVRLRSVQETAPQRFKKILEGLIHLGPANRRHKKDDGVLAAMYKRKVIVDMCVALGEVEEAVAKGVESDDVRYYYDHLDLSPGSLKRTDCSLSTELNLNEELKSKSKTVIEAITNDTWDSYDYWRALSHVICEFMAAWGPGAIMFFPPGKQV